MGYRRGPSRLSHLRGGQAAGREAGASKRSWACVFATHLPEPCAHPAGAFAAWGGGGGGSFAKPVDAQTLTEHLCAPQHARPGRAQDTQGWGTGSKSATNASSRVSRRPGANLREGPNGATEVSKLTPFSFPPDLV